MASLRHYGLLWPASHVRHNGLLRYGSVRHDPEGSNAYRRHGLLSMLIRLTSMAYFGRLDGLVRHEVRHAVRHRLRHEVRLTFLKTNVLLWVARVTNSPSVMWRCTETTVAHAQSDILE